MKKFKNIIGMIVIALAVCIFGAACSCDKKIPDMPNVNASVIGNGGLIAQKGEWLYFVNGYLSKGDGYNDNKYGKVERSAIYRIKVSNFDETVIDGNLAFNSGSFTETENGSVEGAELIIPAKVGFEFGGFSIFKDYLYYITPSNKLDKNKPIADQVEICRVKLNGEDNKNIATIKNYTATGKFGFYASGSDIFGFIYNGTELLITKNDKEEARIENVASLILPKQTEWFLGMEQIENVWWTTENGTKLNRYNLAAKTQQVMTTGFVAENKLIGTANGKLFYSNNNEVYNYAANPIRLFTSAATNFIVIDEDLIIEQTETGYARRQSGNNFNANPDFFVGVVTIETYTNDYLFFIEEGKVMQIDISAQNSLKTVFSVELITSTDKKTGTLKTDGTKNVWTDGIHVYYYVLNSDEYKTQNYYLKRTKLGGDYLTQQNVAVKLGDDGVVKPEE